MELDKFKLEIEEYVKKIFDLILEDYSKYLPKEKINFIKNFDYKNNILIDSGGKYSKSLGRWENNRLALSPITFYENTLKESLNKDVPYININEVEEKLKHSEKEKFTGIELTNLIKQKNLSCLDLARGIVIHEVFHSIIDMRSLKEEYKIEYKGKKYVCRGVRGEYLSEGLIEYYARSFASRHNLFMFPSIPYQKNMDYVKKIEKEIGSNLNILVFKGNYRTLINYIHKEGWMKEYRTLELNWLKKRLIKRIDCKKELDDFIIEEPIEELKLT